MPNAPTVVPEAPVPAKVVVTPVGDILRISWLFESATYIVPSVAIASPAGLLNFDPTDELNRPFPVTIPAYVDTHRVDAAGIVTGTFPESIPVGSATLIAFILIFHVPAASPVKVTQLFLIEVGRTAVLVTPAGGVALNVWVVAPIPPPTENVALIVVLFESTSGLVSVGVVGLRTAPVVNKIIVAAVVIAVVSFR